MNGPPVWLSFLLDALATYRLTRLLTRDTILDRPRAALSRRPGPIGYLATCPWCVSVYIAAGVVAADVNLGRAWTYIAAALTFSAVTGLIAERE